MIKYDNIYVIVGIDLKNNYVQFLYPEHNLQYVLLKKPTKMHWYTIITLHQCSTKQKPE